MTVIVWLILLRFHCFYLPETSTIALSNNSALFVASSSPAFSSMISLSLWNTKKLVKKSNKKHEIYKKSSYLNKIKSGLLNSEVPLIFYKNTFWFAVFLLLFSDHVTAAMCIILVSNLSGSRTSDDEQRDVIVRICRNMEERMVGRYDLRVRDSHF